MMKEKKASLTVGLIRTNTAQLLMNKNFYAAVFLNVLIMVFMFWGRNGEEVGSEYYGVCHELFYFFYFGVLPKLVVLVSAFPVVGTFCTDWNTGYEKMQAGRAGITGYLRHKVYICMAGTFITAFVSLLLYTVILRLMIPMTTELGTDNLSVIYPFGMMVGTHPYLYQMTRIICFSTFCSVWSVAGMALSAYVPNRYVVYSAAFIIYYVVEQIFNNKIADYVPNWMSIPYLGLTALTSPLFGNVGLDFIYINLLFIVLALLLGKIFVRGAERRLRNELI